MALKQRGKNENFDFGIIKKSKIFQTTEELKKLPFQLFGHRYTAV